MSRSIAVLGLGKYGRSLAEHLYQLGADVLAVDQDEDLVEEIAPKCTSAVWASLDNEEEVKALGLENMDVVVTAMGNNLGATVLSIAVAKEQGVPLVVAKSSTGVMSSILRKVGADKVIDPEGEGGLRSAKILLSQSFKDFFKLDENMYMIEINPRKEWIGKTLREIELRKTRNINVVAIREKGGLWGFAAPSIRLKEEHLLLIGVEEKDMNRIQR